MTVRGIDKKIRINNPKTSLINHIDTPPNPTSTDILTITDHGANIHLARKSALTMASLIMYNEIKSIIKDVRTIESTHIVTIQLPGLIKLLRQIHIFLKMQTAP